jgi:hypothetical protein
MQKLQVASARDFEISRDNAHDKFLSRENTRRQYFLVTTKETVKMLRYCIKARYSWRDRTRRTGHE